MRLARAVAAALLLGALSASVVFVFSVAIDAPRVWPGTVMAFVVTACSNFLFLTRGAS